MKQIRIWHQSSTEIEGLAVYKNALIEHARKILGDEAHIDVHGVPPGSYRGRTPSSALGNAFVQHVVLAPILANAVQAEREGYDAFVIGSFCEPFVRELRSAVDIPVISMTEAAFLVACSLGKYSVAISNAPQPAWMTRMSIEANGFGGRVLRVASLNPPMEEPALAAAYESPQAVIDSFTAAARLAIAEGADVIVPAEGMLAQLLSRNRVTSIDGATVIDVFGSAWAYAAMLVKLRKNAGMQVGRAWHYRRDDPGFILELARSSGAPV